MRNESKQKNIVMVVFNNFTHDSRVLKEALTLIGCGLNVTVVAIYNDKTVETEQIDGIRVHRLSLNPLHKRFLYTLKYYTNRLQYYIYRIKCSMLNYKNFILNLTKKQLFILNIKNESLNRIVKRIKNKNDNNKKAIVNTYKNKSNLVINILKDISRVLTFLDFYSRFIKLLKELDVDLIHAHDLNTLPGAYYSAKKKGAKLLYDSHELYIDRNRLKPYSKFSRKIRSFLEKFLVQRCDHVITVNESIAAILSKRYSVKLPSVIKNAPSKKNSLLSGNRNNILRDKIGINDYEHLLIYVGSITFNRGLENVIRSLVFLNDCHLVFMGYGSVEYKNQLRKIALDSGVGERFTFFGPVPSDQVVYYTAGADLGIAAIMNVCLSYYLCSPNKIFEYLMAGIPVIASDFPELRKLINTYQIGSTFNPEDPNNIAMAARKILNNSGVMANKLFDNLQRAAKIYNWENEARKLQIIYKNLGICQLSHITSDI